VPIPITELPPENKPEAPADTKQQAPGPIPISELPAKNQQQASVEDHKPA